MLSVQPYKIEKGILKIKREKIPVVAEIIKANSDELMTYCLADQIYALVKDEKFANEDMEVVDKKINFKKNKR